MKILVTGSKGFIGSHLVKQLNDHEIFSWDRSTGDLKYPQQFPEVDVVIHLAAFNSTKDFYTKGYEVIKDNILSTLNLLDFYKNQEKPPLFMYTGTPESYAGATDFFDYKLPTDEECPLVVPDVKNIRWSYAGSKALGEQAVIASGLPYIIVVPNNIYGPFQRNHFVDEFIERARQGNIELYGWDNTRSWLYVKDFCDAFIKLMYNKDAINDKFNIGSNDEVQVLKLAETILKYMNIDKPIQKFKAPEGSVKRRLPDIEKISTLTQWEPSVSLDQGLKETVEWYLNQ